MIVSLHHGKIAYLQYKDIIETLFIGFCKVYLYDFAVFFIFEFAGLNIQY